LLLIMIRRKRNLQAQPAATAQYPPPQMDNKVGGQTYAVPVGAPDQQQYPPPQGSHMQYAPYPTAPTWTPPQGYPQQVSPVSQPSTTPGVPEMSGSGPPPRMELQGSGEHRQELA
jgi:hypothetical protein